jgi:hypothetical protein
MKKLISCLFLITSIFSIAACSPKFDWREIRNNDAPFVAMFPGKPASHSRDIDLDGIKVKLHMTAADVNQISFSIAYAKLENNDKNLQALNQQRVLSAMQTGMLKNIQGTIVQPTPADSPKNTLTAIGKAQNGKAIKMLARFTQQGPWVVQVIMMGDEKSMSPEVTDMFFGSIKFN